jgi:hypothetical protein
MFGIRAVFAPMRKEVDQIEKHLLGEHAVSLASYLLGVTPDAVKIADIGRIDSDQNGSG